MQFEINACIGDLADHSLYESYSYISEANP